MFMQAFFVHLLALTQLYEAGQAVQHFVSLVRESSIEELTRKVRCAFAHFKCCQLFGQTNGDDSFWRDCTAIFNAPQQLTRSVCIVVAGILNDPTQFQGRAATHNHDHLKANAKQSELLPVLAGMAKSTSMTRRSPKSPKNLSPAWKRMLMISAAYLLGMGDATPISMEPTQPEFEFNAQSSQEGFTQAFPIIASNFVKMNPPSESTLIKFELEGEPSWLSIQDEMLVANIDSAVVAGSYLFKSVVVDSISGLSTTLSMQIKVDDNLNDGSKSSPILQPRDSRRLAYATSIQPTQAVFKYEIKANVLTYIHMPKESGTWIKSTPGDANISITYTLNAVDSSYLTTGSSNRSFHFIEQTTPVVGWRTFTMNAVDNADVANPRSTTLNFQVMSRQMTYNYQDLDPDSLYRGRYAADTDLTRYPWDLDGYEYSGCYQSLASTNPWFYIKYPTPILLDTILIVNHEELGSSTISDQLKTVQLRAGDLTGSPANNPLCLSGNGYLSGSGLYSCGKRVARYIGLIQTAPQTGNVILAICEIHVYSYTPNTGSLTVFNTATQASGLPTKSILTLINGERLDTLYQPILAASSLVYFEIRLGVTRFIHQVLLIGHAINAFDYTKRIILTVGNQIGANVVNNPQFYKMPALDNYDKFGKNVIVMDYGSVVAVIRTDGVQLALHYVGIFSTATDCTDAFDWSGSNLEWASQIFIGSPNQVSVQLFASVSDCAVFYILKMLDNSTLPAWISYSEKTLTLAPTSTASLGTYTVRLNAYLNDLTPYRESYYDFTFTVMQTVPLQPQKPVKVSANETSITIRWFALRQDNGSLTGFNGGAAVTKYRIYYDDSGSFALLAESTDLVLLEYPLTSTTPGKTYGFKVSAVNSLGEGPLSPAEYIMAARVPDPPTLLTKVSASGAQITFSWTAPSNGGTSLTGYKIFWNNGSGTTLTLLQQVAALTTQYSTSPQVTSLTAGASYRFKITALNAVGESALSDEIAIYAATVPGIPSAPTMVSQSETQISIQWTALPSGSDGGSPVTDYKVYWDNGEGLGNFYLKQATTTPAMSFTATSLTAGTTYSFKIAAVNLVGESSQSLAEYIMAARVPDPPTLLTKVSASGAQITFSWTAPSNGGTSLTGYKIFWNNGSGTTLTLLQQVAVLTTQYSTSPQVTSLTAGASYRFKITALNAVGESALSDEIAIYAATVPGIPSAPTMVSQSETQISIQWTALPSGSDGGSPVTDYKVYWDNGEGLGNFYLKQATTTPAMSFTATSLTAGTTYSFKIAAVNLVGESSQSLAEYIMAARVPDPPTLLTKVSASGAQITFSWTAPSNGGTSLTGYKIFWNNGSGTTLTLLQQVAVLTTQYSTSPQASSLTEGALYRFKITALNAVGESALSDEIAIYAATVPGNPSAPTMVSQSETQISIQWTALPSGSDGGSPVTDYKVYWDNGESLGNFYLKQATTTPAMSFTATSLTAGTTYSFKIAAVNLVGESSQSPSLQIIAASLPGPPNTPYLVSADSAVQITISWTAPVSTGGTAITNYKIYMNDLLSGQTVGTVLTFTQTTGLSLGSAYMFKVSAINAIGEGPTSGSLQVFAGYVPAAPNPPTKMFADALHIEVAWTAPSDGGLPIRGYRVYKNGVHIPGTLETGPTILSLIITDNIVPGANYDISVAAFNEVGEGSKSAALTVMAAKIPDAPTGITMISQSSNAIAFRWTAPSDGGTPLIGYKIWWDNGLGGETSSFVEKIGQTGVVTTYTLSTGIIADTVYQIAVKAFNAVGDGPLSTAVQIRAASVPDSPNAPTKLSATTSSISIQWSAPAYDGGNALTKFRIFKDDGVGGPVVFHVDTADSTVLSYTANGLTMGRTYAFKISAWNQVGQSLLSSSVSILCATLPDAPYAPTTSSISSTSITILWLEPSNNGSTIDDYMVLWCLGIDPACTYSTIVATTSGLKTLTINSLTKEAYYSFKVRAHNVLGFSASSPALIEQAVDRLVTLVESDLVDASYEINPAATRPVELNFPTYSCAVCANSISRSLLVESAPQSPLPSFIVPSDSTGVINIYITNPQDTGTYFFKVVAAEIDGQGNQLFNDQVSFRLMLSCTITRFYNVEKIIGNIQYMIPSNLNSPVRYSELPVYKTEPAYCMLLGVENSLVFEGNSDQQPDFVKIDERTRQLAIYDIDPLTIGTYRFYIRAVEPRSGFEDSTVKFEVNVSCSIEQLEPIYNDKTVFNLNFIIRDKPVTFSLPQYSWKPKTCFKEVKLRLVNESDQTGKYPPFFKVNLESMEVSLSGNKEHYIYANREFKLRLIAETLDGAQRNSAYAFVIRTEFKNTPPRFFKDLLPQTFKIGEKAEWHLPLLVDDEGDEITRVAYSPLKPWLKLDVNNLKFQLDATDLKPEDAQIFSLAIYLTDEFGASKAYKQQVELRYESKMVLDDSALNSSGKLNDTSNFDSALAQNTTMSENSTLDDNSTSVDNSTTNATDDEVLECDQQAASSNCSSNPQTSNVADQQGAQSDANDVGAENESQDIKSEAAEVLEFDPVQVSVPSLAIKNVPKLAVQHSWHQNKLDPTTPIDATPEVISTLVEASQCNVQLKFSVPMEFSTVTDPRKLFDVTVTPYIDTGSRRLSGVQSEAAKDTIDFSWQTKLSATEISFFVQFNNTYDVSVGGTVHLLKITQKDDFAFKSKANITMQTKVDFVYKLSAQVTASDAGHADLTTNLSSSGTLSSMLASLVVSTLMYEPLNMLFSMVGSLQYILYLSVLNTNFPGNANLVFKHLMTVMSFDLIPDFVMAPWYERVSKNTNQEDISDKFNQRFEQMGFKTSNWVVNLGSATVFFFWMIALMIILPVFTRTALLDRCRPGRRLKYTLRRTEQSLRWNQMMRFFIEMSFELSLVCAIRVKTYEKFSKNERFFTYSAVTILVALVAFTYLISIFLVDNRPYLIGNRRVLQGKNYARKQRLQQQYSTLWEGIDKKNRIGMMNVPFFMISRIAFVMALIFYQELVTFQLMIVTLVAVWQVLFLTVKPYETPLLTYIEFMNQSVAYIVTVFQYALTDHVPNSEWRYKFGWGVVGVVCFFIAANITIQTHAIIITLKTYASRLWLRWRQRNSSQAEPRAAVSDPQVPSQPVSQTEGLLIVATANTEPEPRLLRPVQTISRSLKNSSIINLLNIVEEEKDEKHQHELVLQPQIPSRDYEMEHEVALFEAKPNDIDQLVLELVTNEQMRRRNDPEKKPKQPEQIEEEIIIT